ncbi:MAG: ribonuclease E/G [Lachnospiraceae bacterium]|nr:ribonuclease E/G [Lachnospiraceae bacterium]
MNNRRQIAITRLWNKLVMVYMENEKIYDVLAGEDDRDFPPGKSPEQSLEESRKETLDVGDIYVGRVQNIVQNINAAFVEVKKGVICYLPLSECQGRKIKCGDERVVQVKKAAVKTKQPVATIFPELAGRFCVVSTKTSEKGISKKIREEEKRGQLHELLAEFAGEEYGVLLRTNAAAAEPGEILGECRTLLEQMHRYMESGQYKTCFSLLRKEDSFYLKYIQGCSMEELERIITDRQEIYEELSEIYGDKAVFYQDEEYPLDKLLGLTAKLEKAFEKRVWLKSGGYLVIEPTEALTVIDVNTGKAVAGKRNQETTFFKMNCEAAEEAARQIRMRNLSGIILIDFIDMKQKNHQKELMKLLGEELKKDKTQTALVDITKLGLVELTRMKKNKPLWEALKRDEIFKENT